MSKKRKLISSVIALALIVAVGTITLHAMNSDENDFSEYLEAEIHRCFEHTFYDGVEYYIRLYATEHIFGHDEVLDELFNAGNNFVYMFMTLTDNILHIEYWPESLYSCGPLVRSGCRPMQHIGPINSTTHGEIMHSGGGRPNVSTPVICSLITINHSRCAACGVISIERSRDDFWCRNCPF